MYHLLRRKRLHFCLHIFGAPIVPLTYLTGSSTSSFFYEWVLVKIMRESNQAANESPKLSQPKIYISSLHRAMQGTIVSNFILLF